MFAGLISPAVSDWLPYNTSSLARLDGITSLDSSPGVWFARLSSVLISLIWIYNRLLPCPFSWNFEIELYHAGICVFNKLYISVVYKVWLMTKASFFLKLLETICDFWSVVTRLRLICIRAEAFRTWKIVRGKSWQRKSPDIAKNHMKCTETAW